MAEIAKALEKEFKDGILVKRKDNLFVIEKTFEQQIKEYLEQQNKSYEMTFNELQQNVIQWGKDKGILVPENSHKQALKMVSEVGELCDELIKDDKEAFKNEFGDVLVTLIILAEQTNVSLTECLQLAYNKIKDRKGKTENGIFKKD